jgi:enoyl-CoA hydratase/carnithine racemase
MVALTQAGPEPGVLVGQDAGIGWIVFDNQARHNALTPEMATGINAAVDQLAADDGVGVVVMRGAGSRAFMSGADIGRLGTWVPNDGSLSRPPWVALRSLEKPLIAMIHGWCLGGGVHVALCADIRIAADDAEFGIPAAKLGAGYPYDAIESLVHLVGPAVAAEIMYIGERLGAHDACRVGLVNRVVPKDELESTVLTVAAAIAVNAPLTIRAAKAAIRTAAGEQGAGDIAACERLIAECMASSDFAEGRLAFAEKRAPRFTGR